MASCGRGHMTVWGCTNDMSASESGSLPYETSLPNLMCASVSLLGGDIKQKKMQN